MMLGRTTIQNGNNVSKLKQFNYVQVKTRTPTDLLPKGGHTPTASRQETKDAVLLHL
jgi:hypothetical protein